MKVRDVMTPHVECLSPDDSVQQAAAKMRDLNVGPLPICDGDRLAGIVTDRDIALRVVAEGRDSQQTRVRDVMTPGIIWCLEDQEVEEAARLMKEKQVRRLVVLDHQKRLCGIVSMGDLAVECRDAQGLVASTLEGISEPVHPVH